PPAAYAKLTPFEKQFWDIKRKHFDKVIFFKKGKFYELYEQDADIGHEKLDLKLTDRVNMRMAGVPESHFNFWASKLVALGYHNGQQKLIQNRYKVGRVDQLETKTGMEKRHQNDGIKSKEVRSL